jgi:hypothetical protein
MDEDGYITKIDLDAFEARIIKKLSELIIKVASKETVGIKSAEAKKILGCSASTLQNLRYNGILPFSKIAGTIYYQYSDLLKLIDDNKIVVQPVQRKPKKIPKYIDVWN